MALYFAYGSNMLAARLQARCPSAQIVGPAEAQGFDIAFDKIGQDGSGKATLFAAVGQLVHGALFRLGDDDLTELDRVEGVGRGYDRISITVMRNGQGMDATAYLAPSAWRRAGLLPFDWYLGLVLAGAHEQRLPMAWIARLVTAGRAAPDPDPMRPRRVEAQALLAACPPAWRHG